MFKSRLWHIVALLTALFVAVGCAVDDDFEGGNTLPMEGIYGSWQFGDEQVPVNTAVVMDDEANAVMLLLIFSPLTDTSKLTTNVIFGIQYELLGISMDVERFIHNYDYAFIYEDPQCYYAYYRPLKSGTIRADKVGDRVSVDIDVVLYDGTPFRYSCADIPLK